MSDWSGPGISGGSSGGSSGMGQGHDHIGLPSAEALYPKAFESARIGLSGPWKSIDPNFDQLPQDNANATLHKWSPQARTSLFDFEMQSTFSVVIDKNNDVDSPVSLSTAGKPIFTLSRPTSAQIAKQLDTVATYADLRLDRVTEIVAQVGSTVPFFAGLANLSPDKTPWTLELLGLAQRSCRLVAARFKHAMAVKRPIEMSVQIQPIIRSDGSASYPSTQAVEAICVAFLISKLCSNKETSRDLNDIMLRLAERMFTNRMVAGVSFPIDGSAGLTLGATIAQVLQAKSIGSGDIPHWTFDGTNFPSDGDRLFSEQIDSKNFELRDSPQESAAFQVHAPSMTVVVEKSDSLGALWQYAQAEWD